MSTREAIRCLVSLAILICLSAVHVPARVIAQSETRLGANAQSETHLRANAQRDYIQTDDYTDATMLLELTPPGGGSSAIMLAGGCTVVVSFEGPLAGDADDDDRDGRDEVDTEMTDLDLAGFDALFGPVVLRLDPARPSVGELEERTNLTSGRLDMLPYSEALPADSFFDVYFELQVGGQQLFTNPPHRIEGTLTFEPAAPGDYLASTSSTELMDANHQPTDWFFKVLWLRPSARVRTDSYDHALMTLEMQSPQGSEFIRLRGPATVVTRFEGASEGTALDDDGDGNDEVSVEIVALSLTGSSIQVGPIQLTLSTGLPSLGVMEDQVDVTTGVLDLEPYTPSGGVDSFFDVFFELEFLGDRFLLARPQHVDGPVERLPVAPEDVLESAQLSQLLDIAATPIQAFVRVDGLWLNPVVEVDRFEQVVVDLQVNYPTGQNEIVPLTGLATILAYFEGAIEGDAVDDDGDARDEIDTEIVALELLGSSPTLGQVQVRLDTARRTHGQIEELANLQADWLDLPPFVDDSSADSFFEVFVEVDADAVGETLFVAAPHFVAGEVTQKPAGPQDEMYGGSLVGLVDDQGNPSGLALRFQSMRLGPAATAVGPDVPTDPRSLTLRVAPNPFNPRLTVSFRAARSGPALLRVFDSRGRLVATLHDGHLDAGLRILSWDGRDTQGRAVASGAYYLRLETVEGVATGTVALVR